MQRVGGNRTKKKPENKSCRKRRKSKALRSDGGLGGEGNGVSDLNLEEKEEKKVKASCRKRIRRWYFAKRLKM